MYNILQQSMHEIIYKRVITVQSVSYPNKLDLIENIFILTFILSQQNHLIFKTHFQTISFLI